MCVCVDVCVVRERKRRALYVQEMARHEAQTKLCVVLWIRISLWEGQADAVEPWRYMSVEGVVLLFVHRAVFKSNVGVEIRLKARRKNDRSS